ncbi:TPA: hypothetical protein DDW35_04580 [Candidatus Sumerlaeota bacterium]|jgi:hypothetical protein|nr:hypothetical protein [Candidatus Sumerlaeota bacterium]
MLLDNAMFYKDITQWLRGRGFPPFFMGILVISTLICGLIALAAPEKGEGGPVCFGFLVGLLGLYTLIIGFTGYNLTSREFQNRTFELYELCGMSLEKMVWGKISSMLGQFLFGFFCIVPFLFVSYLLGGLDFVDVVGTVLVFMFAAPLFYLFMLLLSLAAEKLRMIRTIVHGSVYVFLGVFLPWMGLLLFFDMSRYGKNPLEEILKLLLEGNGKAIAGICIFLVIYVQAILLLFYSACHAISPSTDTRETPIKMLALTMTISLLSLSKVDFYLPLLINFIAFGLGILGLIFFYEPVETPLMARRRVEKVKGSFRRKFFSLFEASPRGTLRTILLVWLCLFYFYCLLNYKAERFNQCFEMAFAMPFYIVFPGFLLFQFRRLRHNLVYARALLFVWWSVAGIFLSIFYGIMHSSRASESAQNLFYLICYVASPLSALITREIYDGVGLKNSLGLHVFMGILGMLSLWVLCHRREKAAQKDRELPLSVTGSRTPQSVETPA